LESGTEERLAFKERNYRVAEQSLESGGGSEFDDNRFFTPREWKQALIARALGQRSKAEAKFQGARGHGAT
jgi:hypothetical protein